MNASDHVLALTKATLSALPGGGVLASLIGDYIPTSRERSIKQLCDHLVSEIDRLGDRIDQQQFNRDELTELIQRAIYASIKTTRQEKIQAAANIVANAMLSEDDADKISYSELDHFLNAVDGLSAGAFHILAISSRVPADQSTGALLNPGGPGEVKFSSGELVARIKDIEPLLVMSLVAQLHNWNLLRRGEVGVTHYDRERRVPLNIPIYLTEPGYKFVRYVLNESHEHKAR